MMTTTLRKILDAKPCYDPRDHGFLPADHDLDAPVSFREIIAVVGLDDTIWCLTKTLGSTTISRRLALDCAERVRHLMTDPRSTNALDVIRRHLAGDASNEELAAASDAAKAAAKAAASDLAWNAARDAAWAAAWAARDAAWAAWAAAKAAASDLAWNAARDAAWDAAWAAAGAAARAAGAAAWAAGAAAWGVAEAAEATDAAGVAVWDATWGAAKTAKAAEAALAITWADEREWQAARLIELTEGETP